MSQGMDMGFDMTSPEGMEDFRAHYNATMSLGNLLSKPKTKTKPVGGLQFDSSKVLAAKKKKKKKKKKR